MRYPHTQKALVAACKALGPTLPHAWSQVARNRDLTLTAALRGLARELEFPGYASTSLFYRWQTGRTPIPDRVADLMRQEVARALFGDVWWPVWSALSPPPRMPLLPAESQPLAGVGHGLNQ